MGSSLLHVILVSVLFELSTENPLVSARDSNISPRAEGPRVDIGRGLIQAVIWKRIYSYRFEVYPVERCPKNISEFETAASRRNCTKGTRYLCAPDKYLSNLIEFCTDVPKSLYGDGNCVRLEGTGGLNHYNCVDTFISGCPTSSYTDDNIYKYPACLDINKDLKCFVAEKDCLERTSSTAPSSTERYFNETKREGSRNKLTNGSNNAALIGILLPVGLLGVVILGILFYKKRRKKKEILLDEKKIREFLGKGDLTIRQVRCIILGCAGAGKTTLLKRLQNVPYKELKKIESTEIVDVHVNSFEVLEDKETIKRVESKNELPTIIFSKDMLDINSKRIHIEQTPVNENDYTEDGESSEDEHSMSENDAILENKDSSSDKSFDKTARARRKQKMSSNAKRKLDLSENNDEENVESEHDEDTNQSIRLIPFSTSEQGKDTNQREDIGNIVLPQCSYDKTSQKGKTDSFQSPSQVTLQGNDKYIGSEGRIENENIEDYVNAKLLTSPETSEEYTTEKQHDGAAKEIETKTDCDDQDDDEKYALLKIMDAVKQLSSKSDLRPRITFLDFAGQSVYYAFHQIYLSPKTCYILVVDMSKRFDEQVHKLDSNEKGCSRFESWTYQDSYNFWLTSIDSFSDTKTPVILVGTHAENKSLEECRKFFRELFAKYDQHPHLRRHLHEDRRYAIGFPKKGSKLEDLVQIKTCIARLVQDPEYSEKHIRPVWAIFEQILQREKTRRIISRDTLSNYNKRLSKEFRMNDSEITEMLLFLHRVGNLLYFDECSLKEIIILDIQWLVDAFKCIVTYKVKIATTDIQRSHFQNTGEIEDQELREIWENQGEKGKTYLSHKAEILSCMEQLGLLATYGAEKYYIPSMNKRNFENDDSAYITSSILCFQFDKNRQSPLDLFYGVILKCLKIPEWSILQARDQNCFYENVACFSFRQYIVVVCLCKFQIQVQVRIPGKTGSIATEILGNVQRSVIEKIEDYKKYWYEIGYKCQNGMLNAEDDNSFIAKEKFPVSNVICEKCTLKEKHYVDNKICWIQTKEETIKDIFPNFDANEEETDEGLASMNHILQACADGNIENFNFHLKKEISPRRHLLMKSDRNGWNVLHRAAKWGKTKIFSTLISENFDLCRKTHDQMTVLHIASKYGNYDICDNILKNEDFKEYLNEKSSQGKNACHYAAESGSVDIIRRLVEKGIDTRAVTNNEQNIFHIACIYNRLEMCEFISKNFHELMFSKSKEGWNATLHAARNGNLEVLKFLRKENISFKHRSESDRNALHIACDHGHLDTCKYVSKECPSLLPAIDKKGRNAGHFAARGGNVDIMKHLASQKKADVTKETNTGMNILHMACLHSHSEMCKYILSIYPFLAPMKTQKNWTCAHFVAGKGTNRGNEIEIFEMLRSENYKVDLSGLTKQGNSVLTLAVKYNDHEFAEYLLKNYRYFLNITGSNNIRETGNEDQNMLRLLDKYLG